MPNAHYKTAFTGTHKHRNRSTLTVHAKLNTFDYKTQVSFKTGNHQKNSTFFASVTKRSKMEIGCFWVDLTTNTDEGKNKNSFFFKTKTNSQFSKYFRQVEVSKMTCLNRTVGCTLTSKFLLNIKDLVPEQTKPTLKGPFIILTINGSQFFSCLWPSCFIFLDVFGWSWKVDWWSFLEKAQRLDWLRNPKKKETNWSNFSRKISTTNTIFTILASSFAKCSTQSWLF